MADSVDAQAMTERREIEVEVAYALPERQALLRLTVPEGCTALEAARRSGIEKRFEDLELTEASRLGIFGQVVSPSQVLNDGDRVEIYRPLRADPKEVRKARAERARSARAAEASGGRAAGEGE
ncbi:MAG: RnfH family protein [Halieaceae bacterium]|nr:RnfH family protein [Halieaceae bacterium]